MVDKKAATRASSMVALLAPKMDESMGGLMVVLRVASRDAYMAEWRVALRAG